MTLNHNLIPKSIGVALLAICFVLSCSSASGIKEKPLSEGVTRSYSAAFGDVLKAAQQATVEAGLKIEEIYKVDESTWVIIAKTGTSAFSWGELVRIVVQKQESGSDTIVRVITKRKLATNVTAKGDYSDAILGTIELKLQ